MLKHIDLENYRCFEKSSLNCRKLSIIVGNNNAGKSTVIEALRIIATVVKKYKTASYVYPPLGLDIPKSTYGFNLNIDHLRIDLRTIVYQYKKDTSAKITACFDNKCKIEVFANEIFVFATVYDEGGELIKSRAKAKLVSIKDINIMPQIGLIRDEETLLTPETIKKDWDSRLSSRHFRNELYLYKDNYYESFKSLAEATWEGLRIQGLDYNYLESGNINLFIYDGGFSAEIGNMGSGIQMWLQIIWFISRCDKETTIILDEPDVYMHPDMQNKVLKIVSNLFCQVIIATHSVEIISEVEPLNIVRVDKLSRKMEYANDYRAVQNIVDVIGSSQNLSLIRLGAYRKCIFVEGQDLNLLSKFYKIIDPDNNRSLKDYPAVSLGGWSRFDEALGAARLFYEQTKGQFKTICILDRDYHLEEEIQDMYMRAKENNLVLIIWNRKELENYLLIPKAIFKITQLNNDMYQSFIKSLEEEIDALKQDVIYSFADQYQLKDRALMAGNANRKATEYVENRWIGLENKLSMVNGKIALNRINSFIKVKYGKSCSKHKILENIDKLDIDQKLINTIQLIIEK